LETVGSVLNAGGVAGQSLTADSRVCSDARAAKAHRQSINTSIAAGNIHTGLTRTRRNRKRNRTRRPCNLRLHASLRRSRIGFNIGLNASGVHPRQIACAIRRKLLPGSAVSYRPTIYWRWRSARCDKSQGCRPRCIKRYCAIRCNRDTRSRYNTLNLTG
jgi:hypothetical protein